MGSTVTSVGPAKAGHYVPAKRVRMTHSQRNLLRAAIAFGAFVVAPSVSRPLQGQAGVRDEMVTMRDGTKLAVSVYFPSGYGPWPAVLTRTPYGKDVGDPA